MEALQDIPYQREFVAGNDRYPGVFPAWLRGDTSVLGVLPTGCGKTICAGMVARRGIDEFARRTLFLVHREELANQAVDKLSWFDLSVAVEMGERKARVTSSLFDSRPDVVVASIQSMQGRRLASWDSREFGILITDEAHHGRAASYKKTFAHFPDAWHLGITATPDRGDGLNLGAVYPTLAYEYSLRAAINDGYLVPLVTMRVPCGIDLKNIKTTGGDYDQAQLEELISPHIEALSDIVRHEVDQRQVVIFTPDVGSAEATADCLAALDRDEPLSKFPRVAAAVSGRTPRPERRAILDAFDAGEIQYLTCCDLLIEGWDCKNIEAVVVMRPTRQRSRYMQMIGRGTRRPKKGHPKADCLIVDFAFETTKGHEPSVPIDLFDDSTVDDEVMEVARDLMKRQAKEGQKVDPLKTLEEAERIVRSRPSFKIKLTGKRAIYQKYVFDPVGVGRTLGVAIKADWDFNPANPASERQLESLRRRGVEEVEGLSKSGAGKLIEAMARRQEAGLATFKQVDYMERLGMDPRQAQSLSFDQAREAIDHLKNLKNRRSA